MCNYVKLGDYITLYDELNSKKEFESINHLQGINNEKYFQECQSNKNDIDLFRYRICRHGMFSYNKATSRNGEKISIAYRDGKDCLVSPSYICFYIKDETILMHEYLLLLFKRPVFDRYVRFHSWGSATEFFTWESMKNVVINLPSINEQRKIVKSVSLIEKRINILEKMNDSLVSMSKQLFEKEYWQNKTNVFWTKCCLLDFTSKFTTGLNPRDNFVLGTGNNYYVTIKNMDKNTIVLDEKCDKINDNALSTINKRSDLRAGDLLFSGIGTIGKIAIIFDEPLNWNVSESVYTIRPASTINTSLLLCLLNSNELQEYCENMASGSAQKGIRIADLKAFQCFMPSNECLNQIDKLIKPLFAQFKKNLSELLVLKKMKEQLIFKIM